MAVNGRQLGTQYGASNLDDADKPTLFSADSVNAIVIYYEGLLAAWMGGR